MLLKAQILPVLQQTERTAAARLPGIATGFGIHQTTMKVLGAEETVLGNMKETLEGSRCDSGKQHSGLGAIREH